MNANVNTLRPHDTLLSQARSRGWAAGMRLAFLHIPKTAGTAFGAALARRFPLAEIASTMRMALTSGAADPLLAQVARAYRVHGVGSHLDHDKLDALAAGLPRGERFFTVTVLREPRARLISQYRHWRRTADHSLEGVPEEARQAFLAARAMPLGEFLAAGIPHVEAHFRDMQARMLAGLGSSELMDPASLLASAQANLAGFDVVGTTDAVDEVLARIAEAYGWMAPDSITPLNVAPGAPPTLDDATEALIERFTGVDRQLWQDFVAGEGPAQIPAGLRRHHRPDPAIMDTLLGDGATRFGMADALDGEGWHVREGEGRYLARWTGPGPRARIRLRAPLSRDLELTVTLVSVLDWAMAEGTVLTLDGQAPLAPPVVDHACHPPALRARFVMPDAGSGQRELAIEVPYTRSHADLHPEIDDDRQKGLAIGDIVLSVPQPAPPATLGALFWAGEAWSSASPDDLVDLLAPCERDPAPPSAERNLGFDLPLLRCILDLVAPDHVWTARRPLLAALERGEPLASGAGGRLAVVATLFDLCGRGAQVAALAERFGDAVLLLPYAEDFRLRALLRNPLLVPHVHVVGGTSGLLVANLAGLRRAGGPQVMAGLLLALEHAAATTPEKIAQLRGEFGPDYALSQLAALLGAAEALQAGTAGTAELLATLRPGPAPRRDALRAGGQALAAASSGPVALVDPALTSRLVQALDALAAAPAAGEAVWQASVAAQDCAFRLTSLLAGWQQFGLAGNATARLAQRLRAGLAAPPLYPKAAKPFGEYIDFYKVEAGLMSAQPLVPGTTTRLDTMGGGLDHVVRQNQAAREIEVALRLLGDRFPDEDILWVDAGCSYGLIMNAVEPPANIRGRCRFIGFDFNAPAIAIARAVAGNLGRTQCRFEVGDVADAGRITAGQRIHLITAFEVLEHCPDPLAVLQAYRAMEPGMLVAGSPLCEPQSILPEQQHLWAFNARGFAALAEEAGFAVIGLNQRHVGRYVGGHDWVTVTATTGDPATMGMV